MVKAKTSVIGCTRDWLYVTDHARALEQVLTRGTVGQTYNIGGDNEQRNIDLVQMICQLLDETRPAKDHGLKIDSYAELIKSELGWQPQEDFSSGFRKTIQWYLENESWWQSILSGEYQLNRQGLAKWTRSVIRSGRRLT